MSSIVNYWRVSVARLDTGWHAHPKVLGLGLAAMGLHAWSISYCDAARTDGFIPLGAWPSLPGITAAADRLVRCGLWVACEGGYQLHDYLDYNHSRAQIDEYVRAKQASGRAGGQASASARARANAQGNGQQPLKETASERSSEIQHPFPVPVPETRSPPGLLASPPTPTPSPNPGGDWPLEAPPRAVAAHPHPVPSSDAIATLYGPPVKPERLPNGAQQCPLCPDIFTGSYADHLDSPRHKIHDQPADLSGFQP